MIRLFLNVCKTFHEIKHLNISDYELYRLLSADSSTDSFACPSCRAPHAMFVKNGCYRRHLVFLDHNNRVQDRMITIKDFKCSSCNNTHALLYSLITPYCPYSIRFIVSLIYSRLTGRFKNISELCISYDISERTFYRFWKRLISDVYCMRAVLKASSDLLESLRILFLSDNTAFHSYLETFFKSCGYSFMQPMVTFRQKIFRSALPPGSIR